VSPFAPESDPIPLEASAKLSVDNLMKVEAKFGELLENVK
jgi:hypothetical protein